MNKFLEKNNVTYIIIGIFILFALIHLYKINSNSIEGFVALDQSVEMSSSAIITIPKQSQLVFTNSDKTIGSKNMDQLLASKADVSALETTNTKANEALAAANNAMPELSIIAYGGGTTLPPGWQLCDGGVLRYYKATPSVPLYLDNVIVITSQTRFNNLSKQTITNLEGDYYITPDLRGRFILGAGQGKVLQKNETTGDVSTVKDATNLDIPLVNRQMKDVGGEEMHKLSLQEMPAHSHKLWNEGPNESRSGNKNGSVQWHRFFDWWQPIIDAKPKDFDSSETGSSAPHNNMPPYYVLTYIIKQPIKL